MKTKKDLLESLHYYQTMVRVDIRSLKAGIRKCKEIGAQLRELERQKKTPAKKRSR